MSSSEDNATNSLESGVLDQLHTKEAQALHHLADELSSCGVGDLVNLPQIIVMGEQSAGKSSVLEAISHVRFPVNSGVCTRFPTELVLRHGKDTSVNVSVRFADQSKKPKTFKREHFDEDDLPEIVMEAKRHMGISEARGDFSKDVLRLEITGPNMFPLTLVDLPGLYSNETEHQSLEGIKTVHQLVESYIKQPNTIILVVIRATSDTSNHPALQKAKEYDPKLKRTMGVITKPDLTKAGYIEERAHIRLAKNWDSSWYLNLGWHVLRNRAEDEKSLETRDAKEKEFFQKSAWGQDLPEGTCGIVSLRRRLSTVLFDHIRSNLDSLTADIEEKLRERREKLDRLQTPRVKTSEKRTFLINIAQRFHSLAESGIDGRYNDPFFGGLDDSEHKFRAQLRNFNRAFDYVLAEKGSKLAITSPDDIELGKSDAPEHLQAVLQTYPYDRPDPETIRMEDLHTRLEQQAASNQGREFAGSPNRDLVIQLFQDQASPWEDIASSHIEHVTVVAKAFVDRVFRHVIDQPEGDRTTEVILRNCVDTFFEQKQEVLRKKLLELWRPYQRGYAMPQDAEFHQMVRQRTMDRLSRLLKTTATDGQMGTQQSTEEILTKAFSALEGPDQGDFGTRKVIDMMQAYYEVSRRIFADNVVNLAIESCLVADLPEILTPKKVDQMTVEELNELAEESPETTSLREKLEKDKETLQNGLDKCRRYKPRRITDVPSAKSSTMAAIKVNGHSVESDSTATKAAFTGNGLSGSSQGADKISIHEAAAQPSKFDADFWGRQKLPPGFLSRSHSPGSGANRSPSPARPINTQPSLFSKSPPTGGSRPQSTGASDLHAEKAQPRIVDQSIFGLNTIPSSVSSAKEVVTSSANKATPEPYMEYDDQSRTKVAFHSCFVTDNVAYARLSPEELRLLVYQGKQSITGSNED